MSLFTITYIYDGNVLWPLIFRLLRVIGIAGWVMFDGHFDVIPTLAAMHPPISSAHLKQMSFGVRSPGESSIIPFRPSIVLALTYNRSGVKRNISLHSVQIVFSCMVSPLLPPLQLLLDTLDRQ